MEGPAVAEMTGQAAARRAHAAPVLEPEGETDLEDEHGLHDAAGEEALAGGLCLAVVAARVAAAAAVVHHVGFRQGAALGLAGMAAGLEILEPMVVVQVQAAVVPGQGREGDDVVGANAAGNGLSLEGGGGIGVEAIVPGHGTGTS